MNTSTYFLRISDQCPIFRSNHWRCSIKKDAIKNFSKSARKRLSRIFLKNNVAGTTVADETPFLQSTSSVGRLLNL